jgi:hypothetical protein
MTDQYAPVVHEALLVKIELDLLLVASGVHPLPAFWSHLRPAKTRTTANAALQSLRLTKLSVCFEAANRRLAMTAMRSKAASDRLQLNVGSESVADRTWSKQSVVIVFTKWSFY